MNKVLGIPNNIKNDTVCKIVSCNEKNNERLFYNTQCIKNSEISSGPILVYQKYKHLIDHSNEHFEIIENEHSNFDIGDIILVNTNGMASILFEKSATSNSIFLTERCNSKCIMCPQPPKNHGDYTDISIDTISLLENDIESIGITGGEPTINWNGLLKILEKCYEHIPDAVIHLLTNARLLKDYDRATELWSSCKNSLLVCIPLYSDIPSVHDNIVGVKNAFWQTLEAIYNLERLKVPIEIRNVITSLNYERLENWSDFLYRNIPFANHVAIMGVEPIGLAYKNIKKIWIEPYDYSYHLKRAVMSLNRSGMNFSIYNHQLCTIPKSIWKYSVKSISEWKNIYLTECDSCILRHECGGFFEASKNQICANIKPITH